MREVRLWFRYGYVMVQFLEGKSDSVLQLWCEFWVRIRCYNGGLPWLPRLHCTQVWHQPICLWRLLDGGACSTHLGSFGQRIGACLGFLEIS